MTATSDDGTAIDDPYLWLEDVTGDTALDWVRARNAETFAELTGNPRYEALKAEILEALDADDRIPYVNRRGEHLYNFWRDASHPRGVWRRTTLDSYRTDEPDWEVLLDVDALAEAEGENWVWKGASVLRPGFRRALIELSRGGADASVVRELDLETREFVPAPEGFEVPEAKTSIGWIDEDHVFVGTDFGPGSLTTSGYPRVAKRWKRGTPLAEAVTVFEGKPDDVAVFAAHDNTEGFERDVVGRAPDFFTSEEFLLGADGSLTKIDVPDDATTDLHREWLTISLRTAWEVGGRTYPAGSLLVTRLDRFLAGDRDLTVLFEPDEHTSLAYWTWTRHHLLLGTLHDVKSQLHVVTPPSDRPGSGSPDWERAPLAGAPEVGEANIVGTDPHESDEYLLDSQSFTEPPTLRRGVIGHLGTDVEVLKRAPSRFDATGLVTRQHFATSDDGTKVPYFVVGPEDPTPETGPTFMTGYGGFEIARTPAYSAVVGRGWLARGGTYVVANIRGGGEYGPAWHMAALREKRHKAYEDFAAVARDLVDRGITTPERLGIQGGSNGGLLMGVMLTTYPERFGAIAIQVPLLDMRRYHLLLAGASWMAEYGDPDDPADWAFLQRWSPYHLLTPEAAATTRYPPVLFVTSTRDDRVHPGHARKMMAKARELGLDARYYENIEGGHGAAADNEQAAVMWALVLEFLWEKLAPDAS
ncbi:MAG TPA: prolyl oligopeptidase family serine peptidase [Acidimicrobiales bacterium]